MHACYHKLFIFKIYLIIFFSNLLLNLTKKNLIVLCSLCKEKKKHDIYIKYITKSNFTSQ